MSVNFHYLESALSPNQFVRIVACCIAICSPSWLPASLQAQVDTPSVQKLTAEGLFASDQVSEIRIEIPEKDWDQIRFQTRTFGEALTKELPKKIFSYVKGDVTINGQLIKDVGIRKKGFIGSLNVDRPSLKIKFGEYVDQSPVDGLDRLTLNNNNQDAGRVCQYLSYKLFRESGTHAPRCGFASVYVNGKHLGVYSNVEPIKSDFLKYSFGDSSGALYEGTVTDFYDDYVEKFETKNKAAKLQYIRAVVDALAVDELDDEELEKLNQLVDVDSFIKYWAMESLIGFWDSYCSNQNNYYLYRDPATEKFHFIPWGADSALTETSPIPPYRVRPRSVHGKAILPNKIYRNEKAQSKYKSTLMSFVDKHWNEDELNAEVDRLESLLKEYVQEEHDSEFRGSLKGYRRFIKNRRKRIVGEFKKGNPKLAKKEQRPTYFSEIGTMEATFTTTWCDKDPGKAGTAESLTLKLEVNGKSIELKDAYVYAQTDDFNSENAAILIKGKSKSTGKDMIIAASLPKSDFLIPSAVPKSAGGVLLQPGMLGMLNPTFKMMFGTIEFEKASSKAGEPVKGVIKMSVGEFKGMGK